MNSFMIEIFNEAEDLVNLKVLSGVSPIIEQIFNDYSYTLNSLNIVLMRDEDLLLINKEFLDHDDYTDIITFNYADRPKEVEGELYISVERIKENAEELGILFELELVRVIFHGCIHLVGFDDDSKDKKQIMRDLEDLYLQRYVSRETLTK
jgi:probable rRNA maturation factor